MDGLNKSQLIIIFESNIMNLPHMFSKNPLLPINPYFCFSWAPMAPNFSPIPSTETKLNATQEEKKKYKRTWKRTQIEHLYSITKEYCQNSGKSLEHLDLADFEIISKSTSQTPNQCMTKMVEIRTSGTLRSGVWSPEEDSKLRNFILNGDNKWGDIAEILNTEFHCDLKVRTGKQCKERWNNHLDPQMNRGSWTLEEDFNLIDAHIQYGNKWNRISKILITRTESSIKNRIKSLINKEKQELNNLQAPQAILDRLHAKLKFKAFSSQESQSKSPRSGALIIEQPYKKSCLP